MPQTSTLLPHLGAHLADGGVHFRVWAPNARQVDLVVAGRDPLPMTPLNDSGYFERFVEGLGAGATYRYRLDGTATLPDPASRFQPDGVHGPSMVVDPSAYRWHDADWHGMPQDRLVFYELHVGTFSPEGTFDGVRERLTYLKSLGITAVELMPVADFPGRWNWGYDHAALFAPSRAYGTPDDLRALVDEAHRLGLAVFLDVIYNHLGPDGAYAATYAPFFTSRHQTPWGDGINLDDDLSEGVRHFFVDNALHWLREYHIDGFRLDATHALQDDSPKHFLSELTEAVATVHEGPRRLVIAEDHRNLNTLLQPRSDGGYGLDGVWVDDFHHLIRNITAGDTEGYYADYEGSTAVDVAKTINAGWFYEGQVSPSQGKPRGTDASQVRPMQCVFCIQNHDQVGNRPAGNRLTDDIELPAYRAASALLLMVPQLPLLFMGQEWAASTPFQFFTDHNDELGPLVTKGRKQEFEHFAGFQGNVPDPQDPATFERSRLDWSEAHHMPHAGILQLYRNLLRLRPALAGEAQAEARDLYTLTLRRGRHLLLVSLAEGANLPLPENARVVLHTEQPEYTETPHPPEMQEGAVYFPRPAAVLLELEHARSV